MSTVEKISREVKNLPLPFQQEVLDFVQFLKSKVSREASQVEDVECALLYKISNHRT